MLEMLEGVLLSLSFVAATLVWFRAEADLFLTYQHGFAKIAVVAGVFMMSLYYLDLYEPSAFQSRRELFVRLLQALGVGILVLALVYYIYPDARLGREVFLSGLALLLPTFAFWRNLFFGALRKLQTASRAAILGDSSLANELANAMPGNGFHNWIASPTHLRGFITNEETTLARFHFLKSAYIAIRARRSITIT